MLIRMGMGSQLSGSVGGVVASRNAGGAYLRGRTVPTNPNTTRQQVVRSAFAGAAQEWKNLSESERDAWESYAALTPLTNRLGESITISGFGMFVRTYTFNVSSGGTLLASRTAPSTPGLAHAILAIPDGLSLSVSLGVDGVIGDDLAGRFVVSISAPLSPGWKSTKVPLTAFRTGTDFPGGAPWLGNQAVNRYGVPVEGQRRVVRVACSSDDNRLATPVTEIVTVIA